MRYVSGSLSMNPINQDSGSFPCWFLGRRYMQVIQWLGKPVYVDIGSIIVQSHGILSEFSHRDLPFPLYCSRRICSFKIACTDYLVKNIVRPLSLLRLARAVVDRGGIAGFFWGLPFAFLPP